MYDDLFKEDMENLLRTFAKKTKEEKQTWICTEYNAVSLMQDFSAPGNAFVSHSFELNTYHNGRLFELTLTEEITMPSEKGNISGSLSFENEFGPKKYDFSLSFNSDYDFCSPEEIASKYADSPIIELADALVPAVIRSEAVEFAFTYARFCMQSGIEKFMKMPLVQLSEKLLDRKDVMTFHQIILDTKYRGKLLKDFDGHYKS